MINAVFSEEPLIGYICIHEVNSKLINSKASMIRVIALTNQSMIFLSPLKFPLSETVIYQAKIKISQTDIELFGLITASINSNKGKTNHYELTYKQNKENDRIVNM
ncbi:hypothetical protein [Halalkalibacter nanhaiisediminis]|uniref:Uncharacterized protein n=1 Tax=Halalkalibacter nanhaiisediminis TaxID=688079 RepID=A0A562QMY9_9BACI|nr:hypothetical protein [Halalkalibacter nanhaiisediminis]TWI58122.1 hypothetical protein IQ10_01453 [Halalkalibacter nanhaiisediminis]